MSTRIALIHALAHSIAPINDEFDRSWPDCRRVHLMDDSLSADLAAASGALDEAMTSRFMTLTRYAIDTGANGVLFTCSAFGPCIEAAARHWPAVPILKPNEAMIDEAAALIGPRGGRLALLATFRPTLMSMPAEFPPGIDVLPVFVDGAMDALVAGRHDEHDRLVCAAARRLAGIDAIALAQFSMARTAPIVKSLVDIPVVTAPGSAVTTMKLRLAR